MAHRVTLKGVRLSFPDLFVARAVQEKGEPRFSAAFLLHKEENKAGIDELRAAIWSVAKEKFTDKAKELIKKNKLTLCLHEGSEKDYEGYGDDNMYVSASSKIRPHVVDRDRSPLAEADGRPYAGCYVNAVVDLWAQDNQFGKKINAELKGVQFVEDGEAFGAPPLNPEEAFEDLDADKPNKGKKEGAKAPKGDNEEPDDDEIPF